MSKITREQIESRIACIDFQVHGRRMTTAYITLDTGYIQAGESCCKDAEDFDTRLGVELAYENALEHLLALFAFADLEARHQRTPKRLRQDKHLFTPLKTKQPNQST